MDEIVLTGRLLIAMPGLVGRDFARTVIYVCAHSHEGAMGLILNRPLARPQFGELVQNLNLADTPPTQDIPVCSGGPVDQGRGFVLHSADWRTGETLEVDDGHAMTASLDVLRAIVEGHGPRRCVLALGYTGWGAGQIESEISANFWLAGSADDAILFDRSPETKWRRSLARIGIDPAALSGEAGHA
ncbi:MULTISPECIES: YqgE/AlgH family protein [Acidiphilium]|uniref:UPF0301 protein L2A60_04615 n=1 Tax=Acidiphilium iwatense TaxID=768198 RepID=A0ABS9DTA8_9PROT|nr:MULTISPECIES: YqgE/AlgH family protein [Acidiphilium]MCF3945968.1 YqgE/AlgH family protein [Acidiphilium iwatense]